MEDRDILANAYFRKSYVRLNREEKGIIDERLALRKKIQTDPDPETEIIVGRRNHEI